MLSTIDIGSLLLVGLLGLVVGGNSLAACSGTIIGSGMIRRRTGILIAITGYILGLAIEGPKLFRVRQLLLPAITSPEVFSILLAAFLIFFGGELFKIPLSLSKAMTGAILGVTVAAGLKVQTVYVVIILSFWILAPIGATALGVLLTELDNRLSPRNLWTKLTLLKMGLFAMSFLSAYVIGSNTLGLIAGIPYNLTFSASIIVGLASVTGAFLLGKGSLRRLSEGFFSLRYPNAFFSQLLGSAAVEFASQAGVPLSITETVSSGIIGSGFASKMRVINSRNVLLIISSWIISPAAGFALAYGMTNILH
jgi:PiT family inorganic phosphate transporter